MLRERYDSLGVAPRLGGPTLVIHGREDRIIPVEHGRSVAAALPDATYLEVAGAGHNDLLGRPEVWQAMGRYILPGAGTCSWS